MKVSEKKLDAYVAAVLAAIESKSIRAWASSEHNAPIVRKLAASEIGKTKPEDLATFLVITAMG